MNYTYPTNPYSTNPSGGQPQQPAYPHSPPTATPVSGTPGGYPRQSTAPYTAGQSTRYPTTGAYGTYLAPAATPPTPVKASGAKKGRRFLAGLALVVACGFAGFGGGAAALSYFAQPASVAAPQQSSTVVYKAPSETGVTTPSIASTGAPIAEVAAQAMQSVVSITTENTVMDYFGGTHVASGAGSGVILSDDGTILTNNHVVEGARNISVTLADGSEHAATLIGRDPSTDVAVIQIAATGLTPAVIGDSSSLQVGDFCLAIGNPLGKLGGTVTDGIISGLDREINIGGAPMHLLQMSAAVSPGNSGGGLFNATGQLIGLVNAKSGGDGAEGLGFAIPINDALQAAQSLIEGGQAATAA